MVFLCGNNPDAERHKCSRANHKNHAGRTNNLHDSFHFYYVSTGIGAEFHPLQRQYSTKIIFTLGISSALVSLIFITPLQYYAMPKLGYTRCNILEGHPTIYFTDWVKKPEWCVRGKSREWVMEQARLASGPENP